MDFFNFGNYSKNDIYRAIFPKICPNSKICSGGSARTKDKGIMIEICNVTFIVFSHTVPKNPE